MAPQVRLVTLAVGGSNPPASTNRADAKKDPYEVLFMCSVGQTRPHHYINNTKQFQQFIHRLKLQKRATLRLMKLYSLILQNFRNYDNLEIDLDEGITALVGENAQGKTNILESIAFLALGKSFRSGTLTDFLAWEKPHGRIRGTAESGELEVFFEREPQSKKIKKHGKIASAKEFLGSIHIVLFTPDSLEMITGSPRLRRQYFDRLLVQLSPEYFEAHSNYQRALKQRNALLKIGHYGSEMDVWEMRLAVEAEKIWSRRLEFSKFLNGIISELYRSISGGAEEISLIYEPETEHFEERLASSRNFTTEEGPHRDDFHIFLNGKNISETGSRGEQRSAVLALKIAQIRYIEEKSGRKPILLLDDVFSELDSERQKHLCDLISDYQTVITSCSLDQVNTLKNAKVYRISAGKILNDQISEGLHDT